MNEHYYSKNPRSSHRRQMITSTLRNEHITFVTDSGVFSKDRIDYGTKLLVESFSIPEIKGDLLDLGCGYGPIGLTLAKAYPKRHVYLTDINKRAISLTEKNAKKNNITNVHILQSDGLSKLENERFAAIITNPPIRAGKKVIYSLFEKSKKHLHDEGALWIVIQKKQGAPSAIKYLKTIYSSVEVINRKKGYFIIRSVK